jgi:Protein of unknown function (DUF3800)
MTQYLFADEAGCFTFEKKPNVSKYFIICTVTMKSLDVGHALQDLRRKLIWDKVEVGDYFHATEDKQIVRDEFFQTILKHEFKVQATILEKSKAQPQVRSSKARFYKIPWFYHFKHGIGPFVDTKRKLLVTAASIGNKKEKLSFCNAIGDVVSQSLGPNNWAVDFRPASTDCCLQIADYCAWAIQRKWEMKDSRSFDLIAKRVSYEYDLWSHGTVHYY